MQSGRVSGNHVRWLPQRRAVHQFIQRARGHGLGLHAPAEIYRQAGEDIKAIAGWLGDKPYFMGEQPSRIDASVYAFVGMNLEVPLDNPFKAQIAAHPNLVAYCQRMQQRCFPKK